MTQVIEAPSATPPSSEPVSLEAAKEAIAKKFFEPLGRADVHHLWTDARGAHFRVNWWRTITDGSTQISCIRRSAFVRVFHTGVKLQVEERR